MCAFAFLLPGKMCWSARRIALPEQRAHLDLHRDDLMLCVVQRAEIFTSCLNGFLSDFFHRKQFEIFLIFLVLVNPYDASCDECVRAKSDTLNAT